MQKKSALLFYFFLLSLTSFAQLTDAEKLLRTHSTDTILGWKSGGVAALNLTQTSFTNWAAGGQNSIAGSALFSVFKNYKGLHSSWDNSLDLGYGLLMQGKKGNVLKTDDKIELLSKYGHKAFGKWLYAGLLNFKTQFAPGYNYPNDSVIISDFLAPAYLLGALGLDYKPDEHFSFFISPISVKLTIVNNQTLANAGAFGVEPATYDTAGNILTAGKKSRMEFGGYVRSQFQQEIIKNVMLITKIGLFGNYIDNPGNIDVNWSTLLTLKVNKYLAATISTELIYDDDIAIAIDNNDDGIPEKVGPRIQFKEVLGVGLNYKF